MGGAGCAATGAAAGAEAVGEGACLQPVRVKAERRRRVGMRRVTMLLWMLVAGEKQILPRYKLRGRTTVQGEDRYCWRG
jgi:hypothetical protein